MGTSQAMLRVKSIVEACEEPVIVVVSALGGVTDLLIKASKEAKSIGASHVSTYGVIIDRHHAVVNEAVPAEKRNEVMAYVDGLLAELGDIFTGVSLIHDLSSHTLDAIVAYGERLSSYILSHVIDGAKLYDSRQFIHTQMQFGKHVLEQESTERDIKAAFPHAIEGVAVVPGFISTDSKGDTTNLGRGGSDYTAAIIAATLDASVLEIWTDVDGFMTADPRAVSTAYVIDRLSFHEAMELCNYGAKVIYPPTIYPVYHKNIPIRIRNTFNPYAPGTYISHDTSVADTKSIKGISSLSNTALVCMSGLGMVGIIGINARIFRALANHGISVSFVSHTASESNSTFSVKAEDADSAVNALKEEFAAEIRMGEISDVSATLGLSMIAIVGENMKNATGIAGKLFNTLARNGVDVLAFVQGISETNISCIIPKDNLKKALNVIHDSFFLSDTQVLHVYLSGTGNVGRRLLGQIRSQHERLLKEKALDIRVVGIANSRKCICDRDGLNLDTYAETLEASGHESSPERICDDIHEMNLFNTVFVDCTSSEEVAGMYTRLLNENVNIVAANKVAASSKYEVYNSLKKLAGKKEAKFLFETNVGAGLPVINTINSMINSGDRILRIEAVVSGTLNYIFNVLSPGKVDLAEAVRMAQKEGFCEPDPRMDLSGMDVIRKIVILARESGYKVDIEDVECEMFLPSGAFTGSVDDFFRVAREYSPEIERMQADAASKGCVLRFVASFEEARLSVGLREIEPSHPFFNLKGSNNVILLTTERYHDQPMMIKGYGAGSDVTAAGVFADIISIANIR